MVRNMFIITKTQYSLDKSAAITQMSILLIYVYTGLDHHLGIDASVKKPYDVLIKAHAE